MATLFDPMQFVSSLNTIGGCPGIETCKAVLTCSEIDHMLHPIASLLERVAPHDYAAFAFRDTRTGGRLRLRELSPQRDLQAKNKAVLPPNKFPPEVGLTLGRLSRSIDSLPPEIEFGYWIPLVRHGEAVGALFVGSRQDALLKQRVSDLLSLSPQVAGSIEVVEHLQDGIDAAGRVKEEIRYLEGELRYVWGFESVIGVSGEFRGVIERLNKLAPGQEMILIAGENGTEKELMARLIHQLSPRNRRLFVKLNCSRYASHIAAKKLFGYEKVSPSGLPQWRPGRLELAHMGTLFLEDVAELPIELQSALLRALREKGHTQSEGRAKVPLDIRVLASTSCDLSIKVNSGHFNRDLYECLAVSRIELVPLRKRSADIPLLVNHFVGKFAKQMKKTITTISEETMAALCAGPWPGNMRELEIFMERAVMLTPGSTLCASLLERDALSSDSLEALGDESLETAERKHIVRVLRDSNWVVGGLAGAASRLGVKRTTLNSKLKKLGIRRDRYP